jgi:hypothetical protein
VDRLPFLPIGKKDPGLAILCFIYWMVFNKFIKNIKVKYFENLAKNHRLMESIDGAPVALWFRLVVAGRQQQLKGAGTCPFPLEIHYILHVITEEKRGGSKWVRPIGVVGIG